MIIPYSFLGLKDFFNEIGNHIYKLDWNNKEILFDNRNRKVREILYKLVSPAHLKLHTQKEISNIKRLFFKQIEQENKKFAKIKEAIRYTSIASMVLSFLQANIIVCELIDNVRSDRIKVPSNHWINKQIFDLQDHIIIYKNNDGFNGNHNDVYSGLVIIEQSYVDILLKQLNIQNVLSEKTFKKEPKLKTNQRHKIKCQALASYLWSLSENSKTTIVDMAKMPILKEYGCEREYYTYRTIQGWIKEYCPNHAPGRRPNTY